MIIEINATVCGDLIMVGKGSTRSSAAMNRRGWKQVENQAVSWEDKKFEGWPQNGLSLGR
jgi:hypothetical protein